MVLRVVAGLLLVFVSLEAQSDSSLSTSEQPNPAAATPEAPPFVSCPAGGPLGAVELQVKSPATGNDPLPFRTINHLSENDTLLYAPVLRGKEKRPGEIALVMVPAKREPGKEQLIVTDPKPADKPQQWKMTETVALAAFVYGPQGLSKKKVKSFLSRDDLLVAQLADYADKTEQAEALVAALSSGESSSASVNAALTGFASQYGLAVQLDKNAPATAQAETLFAMMNPQLASYNPLASSTAQRAGQTASLATAAATLFFGSPVGLAAGGTAMLLDLRAIAFPDTQFRTSFAQPMHGAEFNLCGQRGPAPPHTRVAFIWASRIPNVPTPSIEVGDASFIPASQKSPVPVHVPDPQWKYLQRARAWALEDQKGAKRPINVVKLGNQGALEIDLTKAKVPPGDYRLAGFWDWTPFEAKGTVHVRLLSDFTQARLEPASQDRLLSKAGRIPVTVAGSDFEFTTKVELKKVGDEFATAEPVRFLLPRGLRKGPQDRMDVQINTADLVPGDYDLLIAQQDGQTHPVRFKVLPNPPKIDNLPILANQGITTQHYVLKGERLGLIEKVEAPGATFDLNAPTASDSERTITLLLKSDPAPGTALPIKVFLRDRSEPLTFPDALQITGPLPVIASSKLSLPADMAISIRPEEFPAGYTLTAMLDVKNIERTSMLRLGCADGVGRTATLHIGEQTAQSSLQQLSQDQLFVSLDTSTFPAGCSMQAVIDNGRNGESRPFTLARLVRLPRIDSFGTVNDPAPNGMRCYSLTGQNLEMIEKAAWDETAGIEVTVLPTPLAGPGQRQSLHINLPEPPNAQAPLYIWLRGDTQGRATTIKSPPPEPVVRPVEAPPVDSRNPAPPKTAAPGGG